MGKDMEASRTKQNSRTVLPNSLHAHLSIDTGLQSSARIV